LYFHVKLSNQNFVKSLFLFLSYILFSDFWPISVIGTIFQRCSKDPKIWPITAKQKDSTMFLLAVIGQIFGTLELRQKMVSKVLIGQKTENKIQPENEIMKVCIIMIG
jgi:hypothetical protein